MDLEFQKALDSFIAGVNKVKADSKLFAPQVVKVRTSTAKYLALDDIEFHHEDLNMEGEGKARSIFCFIATEDSNTKALPNVKRGDVMKAATFKAPAKHARGNIFDAHNGLMGSDGQTPIQWTGPHYMK